MMCLGKNIFASLAVDPIRELLVKFNPVDIMLAIILEKNWWTKGMNEFILGTRTRLCACLLTKCEYLCVKKFSQ